MKNRRDNILFITIILFTLTPLVIFADQENPVHYNFIQTGSSYSFYGSFMINADADCLLEISFLYKHIHALAPDAKEVSLIDQGSNWNQISYTYRKYIFFENTTVWHRILDEENQRVDFTMVSSENNLEMMPRIISSAGFYQIKDQGESIIVEYFQQCELTAKSFTPYYLTRVKEEAINFIRLFYAYAMEHCSRTSVLYK